MAPEASTLVTALLSDGTDANLQLYEINLQVLLFTLK